MSQGSRRSSRLKRGSEDDSISFNQSPAKKTRTPKKSPAKTNGTNGHTNGNKVGSIDLDSEPLMPPPSSPGSRSKEPMSDIPSRGHIFSESIDLSSPMHFGSSDYNLRSDGSVRSNVSSYRKRVDIATDSRFVRQINVNDPSGDGVIQSDNALDGLETPSSQTNEASTGPQLVIWGTDVSINACKNLFKKFLNYDGFDMENLDSDEMQATQSQEEMDIDGGSGPKKPLYILKMEEIYTLEEPFLDVNCAHVNQFDANLYRQLINYPQEVIPAFDMAVNEVYFELFPDSQLPHHINIRPFNVITACSLRSLNPEDINQLKTVHGMVIRSSNIIPEMVEAFFECSVCSSTVTVEVDRGRIQEPAHCRHCSTNHSHRLVHNRCKFIDKQQIKLQESPDDMPAGQTPYTVLIYACADLVDSVQPGDRVSVTGIYRASSIRINPRQRLVKAIYKTHLDAVHFRKVDKSRLHDESKQRHYTPEQIDKLKTISQLPDLYERLAHGLAPSIYEHEDIKKGILLQLFGGTVKTGAINDDSKQKHFRAEINILLCGNPGTSKSQILQYVHKIVPRGQYTSGKGSSAVGLTAYITKDPDTNQLVLQTGAIVLSDGGICCIDEFDKMSDSTRSILHEVMEQQSLSIAKAGIVCQLNARTAILAAANPVESQWNKNKTIIENIQLPPTLLSRFDLIFLILDPEDETYDRRLARHLISLYYRTQEEEEEERLDMSIIRDYISYARGYIHPRLTPEASAALVEAYVEMRRVGSGKGQISAFPRQLESLIRLSEARAKSRLSNLVEIDDVEEAKRLHKEAIKQAATDPISGKIDISILTTGLSASGRKRRMAVAKALRGILTESSQSEKEGGHVQFSYQNVYNDLKSGSELMITREMFEDALKDLQDEGFLVFLGGKFIRLTS